MKKIIFAIFAHPDDESFGCPGTIMSEIDAGADVHLITLTAGEAGTNPDNHPDLATVRLEEWRVAGDLMKVTSQHHLGFSDGKIGNIDMINATSKIRHIVDEVISQHEDELSIEFMSFELGGLTGHIDHIAASRATAQVYYSLKSKDPRVTKLRLRCLPLEQQPEVDTGWIFMDKGYATTEIDESIDVSNYRERIIAVTKAHHTQRGDGEIHLERIAKSPRLIEDFLLR